MRRGWTLRNDTRLLQEPHHGAAVLTTLPVGTEVEILEEQRRFVKVRYQDRYADLIGFIYADLLNMEIGEAVEADPRFAHLLPCPRCESRGWGMFPLRIADGRGGSLSIPTGFMTVERLQVRVCMRCGYSELCVDQDSLPELYRLLREEKK